MKPTTILDTLENPLITNPLSEVTRKERKLLLATCVIGFAISAGGLVPEKIETFGITVTPEQEESLLYILSSIIFYFLVTFGIYAWADLKRRLTLATHQKKKLAPIINEVMSAARKAQNTTTDLDPKAPEKALITEEFMRPPRYPTS